MTLAARLDKTPMLAANPELRARMDGLITELESLPPASLATLAPSLGGILADLDSGDAERALPRLAETAERLRREQPAAVEVRGVCVEGIGALAAMSVLFGGPTDEAELAEVQRTAAAALPAALSFANDHPERSEGHYASGVLLGIAGRGAESIAAFSACATYAPCRDALADTEPSAGE